nr:extracellular solute-binding protein [Pseudothermotoga thermarum]
MNIHRANVLWYNKAIFEKYGLKPPTTFDEFFDVAEKLKARGIIPLALGTKDGWEAAHAFETVLIGTLGAEGYKVCGMARQSGQIQESPRLLKSLQKC